MRTTTTATVVLLQPIYIDSTLDVLCFLNFFDFLLLGTKVNTLAQDVGNLNRQTKMYEKKRQMHYIKNSLTPFQQYEYKLPPISDEDYINLKYDVYAKSDKGLGAKFKRMSYGNNFEELDLTGHGFAMSLQQMGTDDINRYENTSGGAGS